MGPFSLASLLTDGVAGSPAEMTFTGFLIALASKIAFNQKPDSDFISYFLLFHVGLCPLAFVSPM